MAMFAQETLSTNKDKKIKKQKTKKNNLVKNQ